MLITKQFFVRAKWINLGIKLATALVFGDVSARNRESFVPSRLERLTPEVNLEAG